MNEALSYEVLSPERRGVVVWRRRARVVASVCPVCIRVFTDGPLGEATSVKPESKCQLPRTPVMRKRQKVSTDLVVRVAKWGFVYTVTDDRGVVIYVGKTCNERSRAVQHQKTATSNCKRLAREDAGDLVAF